MGNATPPPPTLSEEEERSVVDYDVTPRAICGKLKELLQAREESVVVMAGAGISVSAGIPDFRSPGTGLYDNLQKYNLPRPEAIFTLDYFRERPEAFCTLAKEMFPGNFQPTPTHNFIRLLHDKGVLLRCYTQNIDTLEREAGIPGEKLVEAHGSFASAKCIDCHRSYSKEFIKDMIFRDNVPRCTACGGLVKPEIVFFGENLPQRFFELRKQDLPKAKFLVVLGTSLQVAPFCKLVNEVTPTCPRLLINLEKVGERDPTGHGFRFDAFDNYRDSALLGSCDDMVRVVATELGVADELAALATPPPPPSATAADAALEGDGASAMDAETREGQKTAGAAAATGGEGEDGPQPAPLPSPEQQLTHNWRKPRPPMPPLVPFSSSTPSAEDLPSSGFSCSLVEPNSQEELLGGRPSFFCITVPPEVQGKERDFLCLVHKGAQVPAERIDRSFPFLDEDCSPNRLRLRIPWIRLELPYEFEVWYMDGVNEFPMARWGPLIVSANAPEDVHEEEYEASGEDGEDKLEVLMRLAEQLGLPKEAALSLLSSKFPDMEFGAAEKDLSEDPVEDHGSRAQIDAEEHVVQATNSPSAREDAPDAGALEEQAAE